MSVDFGTAMGLAEVVVVVVFILVGIRVLGELLSH